MRSADSDYTLRGTIAQHLDMTTQDPLARFLPLKYWLDARAAAGLFPHAKSTETAPAAHQRVQGAHGEEWEGVNFASQDCLNLSTHPRIRQAAIAAIEAWGVHSAGCPAQIGNTAATLALESRLADFTGYQSCTLFPSGWSAAFGLLRALVRPQDHVILDSQVHAGLEQGARAATAQVHAVAHLSNAAVERKLAAIRRADPAAAIVVVTESLFALDSSAPDLAGLQATCQARGARLVVDCTQDLGTLGPGGRGMPEVQGMVGKLDVLVGGFWAALASNGGFVCSNAPGLDMGLRLAHGPQTAAPALSPVEATVVHTALNLVESPEGAALRARLVDNVRRLRAGLIDAEFVVTGQESPVVPVILGPSDIARRMTRHVLEQGAIVNLVEYPAVARKECRWPLQVMAAHDPADIDRMITLAIEARLMAG